MFLSLSHSQNLLDLSTCVYIKWPLRGGQHLISLVWLEEM